jgi:hypothetical protein
LTVRLTYEHTAFGNASYATKPNCGLSFQTTSLRTESMAYIKRHNLTSIWSGSSITVPHNPLIQLVEAHYSDNKAREAIRKLAEERVQIPQAKKPNLDSSEETVKYVTNVDMTMQTQPNHSPVPDIDPARKIWSEMRKTSRGRYHQTIVSQGIYAYPSEDDDCSPSHINSRGTVDEERSRIKQVALRNKRSVGADTLRSIAPSVGKAKAGTVAGGLGLGRSWGWGGSWW